MRSGGQLAVAVEVVERQPIWRSHHAGVSVVAEDRELLLGEPFSAAALRRSILGSEILDEPAHSVGRLTAGTRASVAPVSGWCGGSGCEFRGPNWRAPWRATPACPWRARVRGRATPSCNRDRRSR